MAYEPHTWADQELITAERLNSLEQGVKGADKQAAAVPEAAGDNVTKAEFKALLDAMKTAGLMASK